MKIIRTYTKEEEVMEFLKVGNTAKAIQVCKEKKISPKRFGEMVAANLRTEATKDFVTTYLGSKIIRSDAIVEHKERLQHIYERRGWN